MVRAWSGELVLSSKPCGFLLGRQLVGAWSGTGLGLVMAWSPARCMVGALSGLARASWCCRASHSDSCSAGSWFGPGQGLVGAWSPARTCSLHGRGLLGPAGAVEPAMRIPARPAAGRDLLGAWSGLGRPLGACSVRGRGLLGPAGAVKLNGRVRVTRWICIKKRKQRSQIGICLLNQSLFDRAL